MICWSQSISLCLDSVSPSLDLEVQSDYVTPLDTPEYGVPEAKKRWMDGMVTGGW